jgi:NRPS condensation-like uncharacterized protein/acyl carrier protein
MYRAYGHIEFMPVRMGFVTPVFTKNNDFFLEVIADGIISEFIPLPEVYRELVKVSSSSSGYRFAKGQECAYAFKNDSRVIIAEGRELALELQKLTHHEREDLDIENFINTYLPTLGKEVGFVGGNSSEEYLEGNVVHRSNQTKELVSLAKKNNVSIKVVNGKLVVRGPKGALDARLLAEIKERKKDLLNLLISARGPSRIPLAEPQDGYVLSSAERWMWIQSQFEDSNAAYNVFDAYIFEGEFSHAALESAFIAVIERHEILRTVFQTDEQGEVKQYIRKVEEIGLFFQRKDLREIGDEEQELKGLILDELKTPFDLSSGPLLRGTLWQLNESKWLFLIVMHHIITDGWSMSILIRELLQLYNAHLKGEVNPLPALRMQYKDYSVWQQQQLRENTFGHDKQYWLEQFAGKLPVLELSSNKPRRAKKTYKGREILLTLGAELVPKFIEFCRQQDGTLFMGLLAAVNALLYRYTDQQDIIIGSPIAGRQVADLEDQIGIYVNTLALRTRFSGESSFLQILSSVKQVCLEGYEHQAYPFDELIEALSLQRNKSLQGNKSRSALFDVSVLLQNYPGSNEMGKLQFPNNLRVSKYPVEDTGVSKSDLTFFFIEDNEKVKLALSYNEDIYEHWFIEQMARHLEQLMWAAINNPSKPIRQLDYLNEQEGLSMGSDVPYMAPRNEAEERLVSIWKEVLGVKKIGIRDNFFDLGGDSLKAVKVITLVSSAFNVKLDVQTLFGNPTIKDFADAVLNAGRLTDEDSSGETVNTVGKRRT